MGVRYGCVMTHHPAAGLRCSAEDVPLFADQLKLLGYRVIELPSDEALSVGLVDLAEADVDQIVSALASRGAWVVVYGDDPDDLQADRFRALGATVVLPRIVLVGDLASYLPMIA